MEWKTIALTVFLVSLCFLAIPIRVDPDPTEQDVKLFQAYIAEYEKPYKSDPEEYEKKFSHFQVLIFFVTGNALSDDKHRVCKQSVEFKIIVSNFS